MKHNAKSPTRSARALSHESAGNDIKARENSGQPIVFDLRQHEPETVENEDGYGQDPEDPHALRIALRLAWCYFILCCVIVAILLQTHPEIWVALREWFACFLRS